MKMKALIIGLCASIAVANASLAQQPDNYKVRLVAGAPGYDHIQPFIAEYTKLWEKYGVKVDFMGGNYQRSNQMMSIGDFDVGYNQYASAIRYYSAGIDNVIVAASSANCAMVVAAPNIKSWADIKGKRIGIVTKFDVQYLALTKQILPRFGLSEKDVQLALVPVPEVASALLTGDIAAAFPFEPYGTNAVGDGYSAAVTFTTLTALEAWRSRWYGTKDDSGSAADLADPYSTGVPNLLAFSLLGPEQNPALARPALLPQPGWNDGRYGYIFTPPAGVSGVKFEAEQTESLQEGSWTPLPDTGSGGSVRFELPASGDGSAPKGFIRLKVTRL